MGAAKKSNRFPEDILLEQYTREGRLTHQRLSMRSLRHPDASLQARVQHIDVIHSQKLSSIIANNPDADLHPIVVFELEDGTLVVADGFHRHDVYTHLKRPSIPAYVIKGSMREALEYATCCNQGMSLGRKKEDIEKAVVMLLEDEIWFGRTNTWMAEHCGCTEPTVARIRLRFCNGRNIAVPQEFVTRRGVIKRRRRRPLGNHLPLPLPRAVDHGTCKPSYKVRIGKYEKTFGSMNEACSASSDFHEEAKRIFRVVVDTKPLSKFLINRDVYVEYPHLGMSPSEIRFESLIVAHGKALVTGSGLDSPDAITSAIGRLAIVAHIKKLVDMRMVIACNTKLLRSDWRERLNHMDICGLQVEFLTPDELVASLKGESTEGAD